MLDRRELLALGAIAISAAAAERDSLPEAPFRSEKGWIPLLNGRDLSGWRFDLGADKVASGTTEWMTTTSVSWSQESPERLTAAAAPGGIIVNGLQARTMNLVTERRFGDFELYLEFLLAKGSNSGVYHHGLYELQIFDSYGSTRPLTYSDAGGIYERWAHGKGFGGFAPHSNASRPPGQWQFFRTRFRAPRFDASGAKKENAQLERVAYNGVVVHENVPVDGPTRSGMNIPEAAENPLMLQGDHGPVAFRNICFRPLHS
jgi:3-keto-disaccharide hydrolase